MTRKGSVPVVLFATQDEIRYCAAIAQSARKDWKKHGPKVDNPAWYHREPESVVHEESYVAEYLVAKWLGSKWLSEAGDYQFHRADIDGHIEVKWTKLVYGNLCVPVYDHHKVRDNRTRWIACAGPLPGIQMLGFCDSRTVRHKGEYRKGSDGMPYWLVNRYHLQPCDPLKIDVDTPKRSPIA
jgi:hypothetical protein